ncbi:MAG: hypothetical protein D6677_08515, partial [Calditrichaeota bacterium]
MFRRSMLYALFLTAWCAAGQPTLSFPPGYEEGLRPVKALTGHIPEPFLPSPDNPTALQEATGRHAPTETPLLKTTLGGEVPDSVIYRLSSTDVYKETFTFDARGNILEHTLQYQNPQTLAWENDSRYSYTYDGQGRIESYMDAYWNANSSSWEKSTRTVYAYNEQDLLQ